MSHKMLEAGTSLRNLSGILSFSCNTSSQISALSIMLLTFLVVLPHHSLKLCTLQAHIRQHKVKPSYTPQSLHLHPLLVLPRAKYQYLNTVSLIRKPTVGQFPLFFLNLA